MAFQYGNCDSFFVEDADTEQQRQVSRRKELEKQRNRHYQEMFAHAMCEQDKDQYGDDILSHLLNLERVTAPDVGSIDMQTEIKWHMRHYLLDFLIEVHQSMNLMPETFFLAINILDRYCSRRVVFKKHYQLVGCTALLIASKYGEASKRVPHIRELQSMCCDQYDEDMFIQMERHVLTNLDWLVGSPTVDEFLSIALEGTSPDSEVRNMAIYIAQMSLMHRDFVGVLPSDLAKGSLELARIVTGKRGQAMGQSLWASHCNQDVLNALSTILHTPSKVMKNAYRHHNLDCVAVVLDNFLLKMQQQSEQVAGPGTPPRQTSSMPEEIQQDTVFYNTPQKNPYGPNMVITPPLTPEGEQFHAAQQKEYGMHMTVPSVQVSAPPTPTPASGTYYQGSTYLQAMPVGMPAHYYDHNSMIM